MPHDRSSTAEGLHTYYGKSHILHGVSLEVAEGKITALLGRNGAGKTTTLRSLMGLTPARAGQDHHVRRGHHALADLPHRRAAASATCRRAGASSPISASRRISRCRSSAAGPWTIARIYQLFPRLEERKLNRGRQLSGGEQEMLSIARALLLNPKAADSRRAVAGPGAADRARGVSHRRSRCRARASRCCWSSRMRG